MDTRLLRSFVKIAELGSISRAADVLGVAQPSLSQQLLRLEEEVGCKLFRRTARGVATTEAGDLFLKHARALIEMTQAALDEVRQVSALDDARVVLAMPHSISRILSVPLAEAVLALKPATSLRVQEAFSNQVRKLVEEGGADLGLLYDVEPMEGLIVKRLAREALQLVGAPGTLDGSPKSMQELAEYPLIVPGPTHGLRKALEREAKRFGLRLKLASEIDSLDRIVSLVEDGHGFAILPLSAVSGELKRGLLSAAPVDEGFRRILCLARSPDRAFSEASQRVEQSLIDLLRDLIEEGRWLATPFDDLLAP